MFVLCSVLAVFVVFYVCCCLVGHCASINRAPFVVEAVDVVEVVVVISRNASLKVMIVVP